MAGVEPARVAPPPPQDGVSTNFTTSANLKYKLYFTWASCPGIVNYSAAGTSDCAGAGVSTAGTSLAGAVTGAS